MSKPIVVLADLDNQYLESLELKFVEELYDKIELEVITDKLYFQEYFSKPRTIEILIVSESLYSPELQRHNISTIFLFTENESNEGTEDLSITRIFKYSSTKEIFNEIIYGSNSVLQKVGKLDNETQVIMSYSPIGGSGKTTIALGISACLSQNHKKVLYIDAENIQNFQYFMSDKTSIPNDISRELNCENEKVYFNIKKYIRQESINYLPPFSAAILSLNIKFSIFTNLVKTAKDSKDYDFIVVDMDSIFDEHKAELLSLSDKIIISVKQDAYSIYKTEMLLKNINCDDDEKYLFICNMHNQNDNNTLLDMHNSRKLLESEYIGVIDNLSNMNINTIAQVSDFQKIAYLLF